MFSQEKNRPGYQGYEEGGPSATPHEGLLVWHLGWLEEVPTQHPPQSCTASLFSAEPSTFQMQHKGSNHGGETGRSVQLNTAYLLFAIAVCTGPDALED